MAFPIQKATFTKYFIPSVAWGMAPGLTPSVAIYQEIDPFGDGVRVEWDISQSRTSNPDQGTFRIFNVRQPIRELLFNAWKTAGSKENALVFTFSLGWGLDYHNVFLGQIWKFNPSIRTGTDVIMQIEAGDGDITLRDSVNTLGQSFAKGSITLVIQYLVGKVLGTQIEKSSLVLIQERGAQLPVQDWNNYVVNGDPQDRLDELIDTLGLEWKIFRGKLIAMDKGITGVTDAVFAQVVSPGTGMISWHEQDDQNIQITSLANPHIKPGGPIAVLDANGVSIGAAQHRVTTTRFFGTNYGESVMEIVARKAVLI